MKNPLVSVICLCYNQYRFIEAALDSVVNQSYPNLEIIIVDDASTDNSQLVIDEWIGRHQDVVFIKNEQNMGSTTSFNKGLSLSNGEFVIDLSGDDVLNINRIEKQIIFFRQQGPGVGVIYSNAQYIDEKGRDLDVHFDRPTMIPYEGDIYQKLIDTYFIPTPTMMIRKSVFDELDGYDENLFYEDFDFWVRSSRNWAYAYQSEILTSIRLVDGSQSKGYSDKNNPGMMSTLEVCKKIVRLNKDVNEDAALVNRLKYEIRQAFVAGKKAELMGFYALWAEIGSINLKYLFIKCIGYLGLRLMWLKKLAGH